MRYELAELKRHLLGRSLSRARATEALQKLIAHLHARARWLEEQWGLRWPEEHSEDTELDIGRTEP